MDKSATMSAWIAEEVKNWTQALANLRQIEITNCQLTLYNEMNAILGRIRSLLGIADDK